jgi:uncharacterized membrane protein YdjX (TVP38/TMEM64 family)
MLETLSAIIDEAGPLAPLFYICGFLVTALLPFIPTPLVSTLGGSLLGSGPAIGYGVIGLGLGAMLALNLSRRLGRPVVLWLVGERIWHEWEKFLGIKSLWVWWAIFFVLNVDFAVMVAGLSSFPLWRLWLTAMIARTPWVIGTAFFGDQVLTSDQYILPALAVGLLVLIVLQLVRPRFQKILIEKVPEVAEAAQQAEAEKERAREFKVARRQPE